ncbi:DUF485 domain-containing protein [Providencia rettgeri]|nr:DUF485 domain-containing protein [Providencia rettgeri]
MLSHQELSRALSGLQEYEQLKSQRRRLAFACAGICLGLTGLFIVMAIFWPTVLTHDLGGGGAVNAGMVYGIGLIVVSWLLTGVYIHIANTRFYPLCERVLAKVNP